MEKDKDKEKEIKQTPQESNDYHFIQEKIKERPINRKKLIRRLILTAGLALVFGLVACLTFLFLEPIFGKMLSSDQDMVEREEISLPENDEVEEPVHNSIQVETEEGSGITIEKVVVETPLDQMTLDDEEEPVEPEPEVVSENVVPEPEAKPETVYEVIPLEPEDYRQLYRKLYALSEEVEKSLVRITAITAGTDWFNENYVYTDQTTGVIVGNNGYEYLILADSRKLQNADTIRATFVDDGTGDLTLKVADEDTGLGIYGISITDVPESSRKQIAIAAFGVSYKDTMLGNAVMAVGNPLGYKSIAYGMVTSDSRTVSKRDASYQLLTSDIYGSSNANGVLVNIKGQIVGIIDQEYNEKGMENLISAYGVSSIRKLMEDLSNNRPRSLLGLYVTDTLPELGMPAGVYVSQVVQGSPAMNAGLAKGDVIQMIDNTQTTSVSIYMNIVQNKEPEEEVTIVYFRPSDGEYIKMEETIKLETME
ncbi:MAG: S1C family serine protease [Lachnospiraceae bacterium]|nr:S1C family serine protease [Lachnospiraceae bacterium]